MNNPQGRSRFRRRTWRRRGSSSGPDLAHLIQVQPTSQTRRPPEGRTAHPAGDGEAPRIMFNRTGTVKVSGQGGFPMCAAMVGAQASVFHGGMGSNHTHRGPGVLSPAPRPCQWAWLSPSSRGSGPGQVVPARQARPALLPEPIVRHRNRRDLPLLYCALGIPRISRRGRGL